jgi:hypothetical protein
MVDRSEVSNRPVATQFGTALVTVHSSGEITLTDDPASEVKVNRLRVEFRVTLELRAGADGPEWWFASFPGRYRRWGSSINDLTRDARGKLLVELRQVAAAWTKEHPELLGLADRLNVRETIEAKRSEIAKFEQTLEAKRAELADLVARAEDDGIVA